jgi:phenylpropionate dioxygenase-like ring-hydroxylating dioxygenase large terminal subunit
MIPKRSYYAPEALEKEAEKIFGSGFQFVCLTTELANNRDFVCVDYFGTAIVVQNFKGVIKAFQNVCSHQFSRIQMAERGNRPLLCPYHGWSYDDTGYPSGMPRRSEFVTGSGRDESLCLTEYPVETCGKFVFIKRGRHSTTLQEYLGSFHQVLLDMSRYMGREIFFKELRHAANWKLLIENVVDTSHCSILHKETFVSHGFCRLGVEDLVMDKGHSSFHVPRTETEDESIRRRFLSHLKSREFHHNSFYHIHIFPNLLVASTEGISFYVGHVLPVGPEETILRMRYFEPNVELKAPRHRARQDLLNEQTNAHGTEIIEEDRSVLEGVQKSIRVADGSGRIGSGETRMLTFMQHYLEMMGKVAAADYAVA